MVAPLWTCDPWVCFTIWGVGFWMVFWGCFRLGFFFRGVGVGVVVCFVFLNDVLEFEWANILLLLRDLNVTVRLL